MKMEEMFQAWELSDTIMQAINASVGCNKYISWNELYQKTSEELFDGLDKFFENESYVIFSDWCFDEYAAERFSDMLRYADENGRYIILSYKYGIILFCSNEENFKKAMHSMPKDVIMNSNINMKSVEQFSDSCLITYNDHVEQLMYSRRPEYVYKLMTLYKDE